LFAHFLLYLPFAPRYFIRHYELGVHTFTLNGVRYICLRSLSTRNAQLYCFMVIVASPSNMSFGMKSSRVPKCTSSLELRQGHEDVKDVFFCSLIMLVLCILTNLAPILCFRLWPMRIEYTIIPWAIACYAVNCILQGCHTLYFCYHLPSGLGLHCSQCKTGNTSLKAVRRV
jgi:hypothetical protein